MLASRAGKKKERKEKRKVTLKKATPEANEGETQKVHHLSSISFLPRRQILQNNCGKIAIPCALLKTGFKPGVDGQEAQ